MATSRNALISRLKKKFTIDSEIQPSEKFDGRKNAIWMSGEGNDYIKDSVIPMFNYYNESDDYESGVHSDVVDFLDDNGWFAEWVDGGTIMIYVEK